MKLQIVVSLFSSPALRVACENSVSVTPTPSPGRTCKVVPQARMPEAKAPGAAALQAPPTGNEGSSLITSEFWVCGKRGLVVKSLFTERDLNPLGVTGQVQQLIGSWSGRKV